MGRVKEELLSWNETLHPESMPADATEFSFWLAANLPLDDGLKLRLLRIDSAVQRLRFELSVMQRVSGPPRPWPSAAPKPLPRFLLQCMVLCCKECGLRVAAKQDVFCLAQEGPMGAYVNPGGHVHETLTVRTAVGMTLVGRPSTENSWFPG